jgi:hypothetical protein
MANKLTMTAALKKSNGQQENHRKFQDFAPSEYLISEVPSNYGFSMEPVSPTKRVIP